MTIIHPPKCGNCHAYFRNPQLLNQGTCKGGPPGQVLIPGHGGQMQTAFGWANVGANDVGCAVHQDWAAYAAARLEAQAEAERDPARN